MYDVISIGSATIDIFIDTKDKLFKDRVPFGEKILIDKFFVSTGGGAINTAVGFSRFGLRAGCIAKVGAGFPCPKEIDNNLFIKSDQSDYSIILDSTGKDRVILVNKINKLEFSEIKLPGTKWIYLSSMPMKFLENFVDIDTKFALNTRECPKELLKKAEVLILNRSEFEIMGQDAKLAKILVITNKDKEIKVYADKEYSIMPHQEVKAVERTGAGDAFAAGFVSGIIKGKDINQSLEQALNYSEKIIQSYGAYSYS